jgi:hypothetical protein
VTTGGINFRATSGGPSGFDGDGVGETYCLAEAYPTTRGGFTFGWESGGVVSGGNGRDRADVDRRLAGMNFATDDSIWRWDIDTGAHNITAAFGDAGGAQADQDFELRDTTTVFASLADGATSAEEFYDANAALHASAAAWVSNNTPVARTMASTILRARIGYDQAANASTIAHISVAPAGGGGGSTLVAGTLSMMGVGI